MSTFAELAGYSAIGWNKQAQVVFNKLNELSVPYVVVGGAAVVYWTNHYRKVTPDLDIIVKPSELPKLKSQWTLQPGLLGVSFEEKDFIVDVLTATNSLYREALSDPVLVSGVPVIAPEVLLVIKAKAGRDKDIKDFVAVAQAKPGAWTNARRLAKLHGVDTEDLNQLFALAEHAPEGFFRRH